MDDPSYLITALVLLPLCSTVLISCFNKYLHYNVTSLISMLFMATTTAIANYLLYQIFQDRFNTFSGNWYIWGGVEQIVFKFGFLINHLTVVTLNMVTIISLIIHIYSINYIKKDLNFNRFFIYINFSIFAMLLLVVANNLLQLLFGWGLITLSCYLLINFYFTRQTANIAGFKAFFINSIGDWGLFLAIVAIFISYNSLDYTVIFANLSSSDINIINLISGLLLLGVIAKSAQIPFHVWLPDAVVGPIPGIALLYSTATVVAGILVLIRLFPIFQLSSYWLNMALILGGVTAVLSGILAIVEVDLKKIIAYSTISQVGIILTGISSANCIASILYLVSHAFVKSALFLIIGVIILNINNVQNICQIPRGLKNYLPFLYWAMLIVILSISGLPGLPGFFIKDLIIKSVEHSVLPFAKKTYYLLLVHCCITSWYSFKLFFHIFYNNSIATPNIAENIAEYNITAKIKACIVGLIVVGFSLMVILIKLFQANITANFFENLFKNFYSGVVSKTFWCSVPGFLIAWLSSVYKIAWLDNIGSQINKNFLFVDTLLRNKYFFNHINRIFIIAVKKMSDILFRLIENLLIDKLIINYASKIYMKCSKNLKVLYTGCLNDYIFFMFSGVIVVLLWLIFTAF